MNSPHLGKGSLCPALKTEIRIYNMRFCPYAQRSVLMAIAKNIPHDIVNCNLVDKPEWLLQKNPDGKVPAIELQDGKVLYESLIVSEYLEDAYKNNPLTSSDAFQRAADKLCIEEFNKVITIFYKMVVHLKTKDMKALKEHLEEFQKSLMPFEADLEQRGTIFFGGNHGPGFVDYMIWPWIERIPIIKLATADVDVFDFEEAKQKSPKLETWRKAMKDDKTIQQYIISPDVHLKFIQSYLAGSPNYDLCV